MKHRKIQLFSLLAIIACLAGYIVYDKFSFTEDMARATAKKFFNLLMTKGHEGFQEIYPTINNGSRIVTNKLCRISNITKRDDGNYDVYASYEPSQFKTYPVSIVVNRDGNVVSSRGISYSYFDKTLEYGKKIGCLTGEENDSEMEQIIESKNLRRKLDNEVQAEISGIYEKLEVKSSLESNYGYTSGNIVVTNNSPYDLEYGDMSFKINYYNSRGDVVETNDIHILNLKAYSSESSYAYGSSSSASKYTVVKDVFLTDGLKSRVKDQIIRTATYGCF